MGYGAVYVQSLAAISAINDKTGAFLWSYPASSRSAFPKLWNGTLYTNVTDGRVLALDARTGALLWSYYTGNPYGVPAVTSSSVFVNGADKFYALNPKTGALLWSYYLKGATSPAAAYGLVFYAVNGWLVAVNGCTGHLLWEYNTGDSGTFSAPAIANGWIHIVSHQPGYSNIIGVNLVSPGWYDWVINYRYYPNGTAPVVANGFLYVPDYPVIVLTENNPSYLVYFVYGPSNQGSQVIVANGMIYMVGDSGELDAFGP